MRTLTIISSACSHLSHSQVGLVFYVYMDQDHHDLACLRDTCNRKIHKNFSWKYLGFLSFQTGSAGFFTVPGLWSRCPQEALHIAVKASQMLQDMYTLVFLRDLRCFRCQTSALLSLAWIACASLFLESPRGCLVAGWEQPRFVSLSASAEKHWETCIQSTCNKKICHHHQ